MAEKARLEAEAKGFPAGGEDPIFLGTLTTFPRVSPRATRFIGSIWASFDLVVMHALRLAFCTTGRAIFDTGE